MAEEIAVGDDVNGKILTAEYKDGQLQIVEVTPFDNPEEDESDKSILPTLSGEDSEGTSRYMQVLDPEKGLVQLDLLNLALVKCEGSAGGFRLVANTKTDGQSDEHDGSDTTITCVLQGSDGEEPEGESYVVVEGEGGPVVYLQSAPAHNSLHTPKSPHSLTPAEIIERAKALQKAKSVLQDLHPRRRGRKRRGELPPPHELLSSPNFKLYLYSCKMCSFKCNAVKELTKHRATEHSGGGNKYRIRSANANLQCAKCPYRANLYSQLESHLQEKHKTADNNKPDSDDSDSVDSSSMLHCGKCSYKSSRHSDILKHVKEQHSKNYNEVHLNSQEAEEADVLVCGACGFESGDKQLFREHIQQEHGATAC